MNCAQYDFKSAQLALKPVEFALKRDHFNEKGSYMKVVFGFFIQSTDIQVA